MTKKKVLALAPISGYGGFNTSIHRIDALKSLGFEVETIDSTNFLSGFSGFKYRIYNRLFRMGLPLQVPDISENAGRLINCCSGKNWDIIWLDKAMTIPGSVLRIVKKLCPSAKIIGFSPDDMYSRHNQTHQFLDALTKYDIFITTKTYNVEELQQLGCPRVIFMPNGYDPVAFQPIKIEKDDYARLGGVIGFIGTYELERAESMLFLAEHGLKVRVWGNGWEKMKKQHPNLLIEYRPLYGDDFAKACGSFLINLCFLRKINRDLQTTRSVEIPACGGFMLAERTSEHQALFQEAIEADFFCDDEELFNKCKFYLSNRQVRDQIAKAGYQRCVQGEYSNAGRFKALCAVIEE